MLSAIAASPATLHSRQIRLEQANIYNRHGGLSVGQRTAESTEQYL